MQIEYLSHVIQGGCRSRLPGAGAIIKHNDENDITGLTTASGVWLTAALGIAAGMGLTALISAMLAFVILALVRHFL